MIVPATPSADESPPHPDRLGLRGLPDTYLMRHDTPEGAEFCRRFPSVKIADPPTFLREMEQMPEASR